MTFSLWFNGFDDWIFMEQYHWFCWNRNVIEVDLSFQVVLESIRAYCYCFQIISMNGNWIFLLAFVWLRKTSPGLSVCFYRYALIDWCTCVHVNEWEWIRFTCRLLTVLVLIKLTNFAVALRLRCGSCKKIFFTLYHHFSLNLRTLYIVWSLVRRRVTRVT